MSPPIISKNIRVRYLDTFTIGRYSIVDDFCYFSTRVEVGECDAVLRQVDALRRQLEKHGAPG